MADRSVILVEGDLGIGTTSFGNIVRYRGPFRTTRMEIAVYRGWNSQTLLENVMVAILHDLLEDPETRKAGVVKSLRPLVEHVERSVHSAGISLVGFGGHVTRNVAVTQPGIIPMETLRQNLLALAEVFRPKNGGASFVLQLNNLDPSLTFTKAELASFLNDIRDSLQLPGYSWMLVGKDGLGRFVTDHVPRLRSILSHDVILPPLSLSEVETVMTKRIAACRLPGRTGKNPIERDLFRDIYEAAGGSLRETFNICSKLCLTVAGDPLYKIITPKEAGALLAELLAVRLSGLERSPLQREMLIELSLRPGLSQKQLAERIGKDQTNLSRAARMLVDAGLLRRKKEGRLVRYWPSPEVRLAAEYLK